MRWKHCPELKWKLNSKSHWWGQAAGVDYVASPWRGSSRIFFSFFFLRMILVSQGSVGSLCAAHSASSRSAWYALFVLMWWIQGVTPAALTAVGMVRTTVYGPFWCGAKQSCFHSSTHTWSPAQICGSVPQGGTAPFLIQTKFSDLLPDPVVPSAAKSHLLLPEANLLTPVLLWEGASHTQFHTENSHGTLGSSWVWAEPSETSPPTVSLCDPLGGCLFKCPVGSFHHPRTLGLYAVCNFHLMFKALLIYCTKSSMKARPLSNPMLVGDPNGTISLSRHLATSDAFSVWVGKASTHPENVHTMTSR